MGRGRMEALRSEASGLPPDRKQPADPATLVCRIRAGERAAEREMVARYSRGVTFLLRELTGNLARADDLHQETFRLVLVKVRAGELREPDKLAAFIRQIARNLFIAEYRRNVKRRVVGSDQALASSPDPHPGPLKSLLDRENAAIVRKLLAELEPRRDREILFRFFVAEQPKEEICADLALSSLHFNRVLHRARHRLKDRLARYYKRQRRPTNGGDPGRERWDEAP